ncbi:PilN domain-containing protein [Thermovenabulum sp.]|uniref:PilN domain-containing protein n=1 Tax=Thermovenabulum sp. TaxID=3100335 RepID=UPI003C7CB357
MSRLNLIPQEILLKRKNKKRLVVSSFVIIIIFTLVIYYLGIFFAFNYKLEREIAFYQNKISQINNQIGEEKDFEKELKDLKKRQELYNSLIKGKIYFFDLISKIESKESADINLTSINLKDRTSISIAGYCSSLSSCSNFLRSLRDIENLKEVNLNHVRFDSSKNIFYFEITLSF